MGIRTIGGKKYANRILPPDSGRDGDEGSEVGSSGDEAPGDELELDGSNGGESDEDTGFTNPESLTSGDDNNSAPFGYTKSGRRRNRPIGSAKRNSGGGRSSGSGGTKTSDAIAAMLNMTNSIAAAFLKMPSLKISKESCQEVAVAAKDVMDLYDIPLLNEKGMAWANLIAVTSKAYIFNAKESQPIHVINKPMEPEPMPIFMGGKSQ